MTELERQLSEAFAHVSKEFQVLLAERDQAISGLLRQVSELSQSVSSLTTQLEQSSASNVKLRRDLRSAFEALESRLTELSES